MFYACGLRASGGLIEPMYKLVAFFVAVVAFVYAEPGSSDVFRGFVLPAAFLVAFVILFTVVGSLILGFGAICFYFTDVSSASTFHSVLSPLLFTFSLAVFVVWAWKAGYTFYGTHGSPGDGGGDAGGG